MARRADWRADDSQPRVFLCETTFHLALLQLDILKFVNVYVHDRNQFALNMNRSVLSQLNSHKLIRKNYSMQYLSNLWHPQIHPDVTGWTTFEILKSTQHMFKIYLRMSSRRFLVCSTYGFCYLQKVIPLNSDISKMIDMSCY